MADPDENNQAVVEVPEEGVVTIELPDDGTGGTIVGEEPEKKLEPEKPAAKTEPPPRVRIKDPTPKDPTEEDKARANLEQTLANERRLRQNAEQQANTERQRAETLARQKQESDNRARTAQESADASHLASIDNGIANATSQIAAAQKDIANAMSEGKFEVVAEAQTRLSRASARLDRLEADKEQFTTAKANREAAAAEDVDDPGTMAPAGQSPIDQYVARMAPKAQEWIRNHPDCVPASFGGDDAKNAQMMRGHYDALTQGYKANTDDYFRVIEESLGLRQPAGQDEEDEEVETKPAKKTAQTQPPKSREARPSAPPSRTPPGSPQTGGSRTVRLNQAEQEAARFSYPHMEPNKAYAEYAKNKVQLEAEGKLGRTTH